jgi:hypothetical protein
VGFVGIQSKFTARLHEFSLFGLSVKTSQEVAVGAIFRLGIKVDADYFRAAGVVRSKTADGFAVEFLSMTAIDRQLMRRLYLRMQTAARAG